MSISLEKVSYIYEDNSDIKKPALIDVDLEIGEGEFIGIIGHTGSGKSTLIQHLNGLMEPTKGHVYFEGKNIHDQNYDLKSLRGKVGLCFQYPEHQLFETTILEDVCFGPANFGASKEEALKAAKEALTDVGVPEELFEKSPFELSGGQKRRVAIAGILAMKPKYFILDEPTAGLDPEGRVHLLNLLKRLNQEQGITIILVSHSMEDIASYVDRLIVMNRGRLEFDGEREEVFSHQKDLEQMGLSVPFFRYLANDLKEKGFPLEGEVLTLDDAKTAILKTLKKEQTYD
ncbi:energy-coupling factor transporter ATPase [Anaerostipes sp.]|uniref:energy-coupling factor transporter ATPase n=1 Tax=Anaerostipes sp. TaxID=1872530 RepID=UPI0025BCD0AC|nr:energy-coupling factor transporter ATPase [Anaerostipes sp.]MBS7008920.1 energy-coupling factor transporter ATPase [Anaerostipes sp.]